MSNISKLAKDYNTIVQNHTPKVALVKNCFKAFWVGGVICTIGQILVNLYLYLGLQKTDATTLGTVSLIFLSMLLTALNIYDNIGNYGGAGAAVPITGFANGMVSSAMEFKKEGYIMGMGAKLFTIAGPVIVFGVISSVIIGIIYYLI